MGAKISRFFEAFGKKDARIVMVGLDAAGKTTVLYKIKLNDVVTTIPTIGFNVERVEYKNLRMTIWDIGGQDRLRPLWRHYYDNTNGVIFVLDSCDETRMKLARDEIHKMMEEPATNTSSVQPIVAIERTVFYRERAAGLYSALPYAFAQVAIEAIYVTIQSIFYSCILYTMIGYEWKVGKFLWFLYFIITSFIYFTLYGMMLVALTPGHQIAAIVMSFFLSFWNLFSGFLIPRSQIPIWWRWYYWASPVAWTIYGLVASQVGDKDVLLEIPGAGNVPLKVYLKETLGFDHDFLPAVGVAHIGWVLLFFFVFAYGIKFLNFQRR